MSNNPTILQLEKQLDQYMDELSTLKNAKKKVALNRTINAKLKAMQDLTAWDRVLLARHPNRPHAQAVIAAIFQEFTEFHGDRLYGDDPAIVGGIGLFNGIPVTVIAHLKGDTTEENIKRNFAMSHPEGYRKALRLMKQAAKFKRPIMTFIDTPGAYPGLGAEERGQAEAIAQNLKAMSHLPVPIITVILGEGGSGGALALGVSNHIWMTENSIYSVLSPEGYASILWKDASRAKDAAEAMKLTAHDVLEMGLIDGIIKEPIGGAQRDPLHFYKAIKDTLRRSLEIHLHQPADALIAGRYQKFRNMGFYQRFNVPSQESVHEY